MLGEGAILGKFLLTKLLCQTPYLSTFVSIHVESNEKFITQVVPPCWQEMNEIGETEGFAFKAGRAHPWKAEPNELLSDLAEHYLKLEESEIPGPHVLDGQQEKNGSLIVLSYFEGYTLGSQLKSGNRIPIKALVELFERVDKLHEKGYFHGNLSPSSILVGKGRANQDRILLLSPTMPFARFESKDSPHPFKCITNPRYYPFLEPRQDQLALGLLLYEIATGMQPFGQDRPASKQYRRAGPRLARLIEMARQQGANRYLNPILDFANPDTICPDIPKKLMKVILQTTGFSRINTGTAEECVEIVHRSWLETWPDVWQEAFDDIWGLKESGKLLAEIEDRHSLSSLPHL